ncbi:NEL-type E3 ubiquitin ligase domain-containing protein [Pseudomonas sp. Irchel s3h17]|uniref:NEL-type E3 ubiquitin ligase domain-containing protein n=1 Tax=Pseudomonas sp. Irchel s3h17 TaxID=2009182 RepID=UPI000BA3198C|nr:NEL-type E3 ubiquitin ligase domain-containing protein [Pseudomonas sp. Irchel s3h17]
MIKLNKLSASSGVAARPGYMGSHYEFIRNKLPAWLLETASHRRKVLRDIGLLSPGRHKHAAQNLLDAFKYSSQQSWTSQNSVDRLLLDLKDAKAFARPLLQAAILEKFKVSVDVDKTLLRHSVASPEPFADAIVLKSSLLDAALHNFTEDDETDAFIATRTRSGKALFLSPHGALPFTVEQFAGLCRELDLGGKYQAHINTVLGVGDVVAEGVLNARVRLSQQHAFSAAIDLARLQGNIDGGHRDGSVYRLLAKVTEQPNNLMLDGKPVQFNGLKLLGDTELLGVLLIGPDRISSDHVQRLVVYIPHDPISPIREYASAQQFHYHLREQLRDPAYQTFFSRFVKQEDKARFFKRLNERLTPLKRQPNSNVYVNTPDPDARIHMEETPVRGELWGFLFDQQLNKLLNDAKCVAVSTADVDAQARHDKLFGYLGIALSVFNVVALFVPPLGVAMMAVMAAQLTDELVEGIESLAQGDRDEGFTYLMDVAQNIAQLALMSAVGAENAEPVTGLKRSPFFDSLKEVTLPNGETRLWKPDLAAYEQKGSLPQDLKPDESGLLRHDGQVFLTLGGKRYGVKKDPVSGQYRIAHPDRANAYAPKLNHNGHGAWSHEVEQPRTWTEPELMRRLGPRVSEFSDTELVQIRRVSGVDESVLRKMYVENEPPAPILVDTISRFDAYRQVENFIADMKSDLPVGPATDHSINQLHVMTRYGKWPDTVSIRIIDGQAQTLWEYVNPRGAPDKTRIVQIHDVQIRGGRLLRTLLECLDENETNVVLGHRSGTPRDTLDIRIKTLRENLAKVAERHEAEFFNDVYNARSGSSDPRLNLIKSRFSNVPTSVIEQLLVEANSTERQQMAKWDFTNKLQTKPIPLRLAEELRWIQREVRVSRAYEGLYLDALMNRDAEALALNSLSKLPGWTHDLRVEVRDGSFSGELRASVGPQAAGSRKVLLRNEEGRYEVRDQEDGHLHGADDFYAALQHALPDTQRQAIGLPHVGQGPELKALIRQHVLARGELRSLLGMQPIRPGFRAPQRWADGRLGYPLSGRGAGMNPRQAVDKARVLKLFPGFTDGQVERFLTMLGAERELYLVNFEAEYQGLLAWSEQWLSTPSTRVLFDGSVVAVEQYEKQVVVELLKRSWQKQTARYSAFGYPRGYELVLRGRTVGALPALEAYFTGVEFVDLSGMDLVATPNEFLDSFPDVRWLYLRGNRLADIPAQLGSMRNLVGLDLSSNNIRLTPDAAALISGLSDLKKLQLSHNPLERTPDFSQMVELTEVRLQATGIRQWPSGLEHLRRLELLDLRDNQLTSFPDWAVNPPPEQAAAINRLLSVTELNGNPLSEQGVQQYADILQRIYLENSDAGVMPVPVDLPAARGAEGGVLAPSVQRVDRWLRDIPVSQYTARKELWTLLDSEAIEREAAGGEAGRAVSESEEFFRLLEKLSQTAEYKKAYPDLQARVWTVLEAAGDTAQLREELFRTAGEPETCSDRAALMFSDLEVKVQIHKALAHAGDKGAGPELLKLAKGLFRLDEVEAFALKDVKERVVAIMRSGLTKRETGRQLILMDQIEVRLSYRVSLREKLDLPGQPTQAQYTGLQYVSGDKLAAAEQHVNSLKASKAETDSIARRDFWTEYLKEKYSSRFNLAYESINERLEQLEFAKGTMTSGHYNTQSSALAAEAEVVERKLINLLTPQEILDLEEEVNEG